MEEITNPGQKTWWTKRILSDKFHCAGRLSERQLKYAAESGFKNFISIHTYHDFNPDDYNHPIELHNFDLPSTNETKEILSYFDDVTLHVILPEDAIWKKVMVAMKLIELMKTLTGSTLIYCTNSYASVFFVLAYYAHMTFTEQLDPEEPEVSVKNFFKYGSIFGYDFGIDQALVEIVSQLTDKQPIYQTQSPDTEVANWYNFYWPMKPVYKGWFICGQFQSDQLKDLSKVGFKTLINTRLGKPVQPSTGLSQEEVSLLNISDNIMTRAGRQESRQLLSNRIQRRRPASYIRKHSWLNYEFINPLEFGDETGYNDVTEKRHLAKEMFSTKYIHIPMDSRDGWCTRTNWKQYEDVMTERCDLKPMLIHCRTGTRSVQLALLAAAHATGKSDDWVLHRARILGFNLTSEKYRKLLQDLLNQTTTSL